MEGFGGVLHRSGLTEHWPAGCTGAVSSIISSESEEDAGLAASGRSSSISGRSDTHPH